MNFLGHALLSFGQPGWLVGNLVADHVKGHRWQALPPAMGQGILLHRAIDGFTDAHPAVKQAAQWLKPLAGRYAGAFMDLVMDHFLATDKQLFPTEAALDTFARNVYATLEDWRPHLPETFLPILEGMHRHHFLFEYRRAYGMEKAFEGLSRRAKGLPANPYPLFQEHYPALAACYPLFWPAVQAFALSKASEWQGN